MKRFLFLMCALAAFSSCLASCSRDELIPDQPFANDSESMNVATKSPVSNKTTREPIYDEDGNYQNPFAPGGYYNPTRPGEVTTLNGSGGGGTVGSGSKVNEAINDQNKRWGDNKLEDFDDESDNNTEQNQVSEKIFYFVDILPRNGGKVYGSGEYEKGTTVTCYAVPDSGFKFVRWSGGTITSTSQTITFTVNDDIFLIPQFVRKSQ